MREGSGNVAVDRRTCLIGGLAASTLVCSPATYARTNKPLETANAWIEVDLGALRGNIDRSAALVGGDIRKICAILKADAYGTSIAVVMPALLRKSVSTIGVASNEEIAAVRRAGFRGRLLRVRSATPDEIADAMRHDVEEMMGNLALAQGAAAQARKRGRPLRVHIAINAGGMSRNGVELSYANGKELAAAIATLNGLKPVGVMTHFPVEEKADVIRTLERFNTDAAWLIEAAGLDRKSITIHTANSFTAYNVPEARLDMVRVGGTLYGIEAPSPEFRQIITFKTRIAAVNSYPAGATVGYDRTTTLKRDSHLANLPVGYSDGFRRAYSNNGTVLIAGQRAPVVGRVSMNTIMVDVTDIETVNAGQEVVLFGRQGDSQIGGGEVIAGTDTNLTELIVNWGATNPRFAVNS